MVIAHDFALFWLPKSAWSSATDRIATAYGPATTSMLKSFLSVIRQIKTRELLAASRFGRGPMLQKRLGDQPAA